MKRYAIKSLIAVIMCLSLITSNGINTFFMDRCDLMHQSYNNVYAGDEDFPPTV